MSAPEVKPVMDAPEVVPAEGQPEEPPVKPVKKKLTKAEKKELKRQQEVEFKKLELKLEYQRELELSRKTSKKLKTDWEETLVDLKIIELKEELKIWQNKAQRQLVEKDVKIETMVTLINNLEESNQFMASRLKGFLNYVTDIYKTLTTSSRLLYESTATDMIVKFHEALENRHRFDQDRRLNCENAMHTTNLVFERELLMDYNIFVERRNDNVNRDIERRYRMRDAIVTKMKDSMQQLLEFADELSSTNLDPYKYDRIRQLMEKQRTFYTETTRLNSVERRQRRALTDLQRDLLVTEMRTQKMVNDLKLEQTYFQEIRKNIEAALEADENSVFSKLKILTSLSYNVIKKYKKLREDGELMLSIGANVRKLQTEPEKILVWGDREPPANQTEELRKFVLSVISTKKHLDHSDEDLFNAVNLMRVFWRRLAIVETQNSMLNKEKQQLTAENKKFQDFIRKMSTALEPDRLGDAIQVKGLMTCPQLNVAPSDCGCPSNAKLDGSI